MLETYSIFITILFVILLFSNKNNLLLLFIIHSLKIQIFYLKSNLKKSNKQIKKVSLFHKIYFFLLSICFKNWKDFILFVNPKTILSWHNTFYKIFWRLVCSTRFIGRPAVKDDLILIIKKLSSENPSWQATRILGELEKLGFKVSLNTVKKYIPIKRKNNPSPTWKQFLELHKNSISAFDFFTIPTWNFKTLYIFFFIDHSKRKILTINTTFHPTRNWIFQQFKNAFYDSELKMKYLIHDNDILFQGIDLFFKEYFDIDGIRITPRSPWQNGIAERFVRTIREELFNHVIVIDDSQARNLAIEYMKYYNEFRTHSHLARDSPLGREIMQKPASNSVLHSTAQVRGLHHSYSWDLPDQEGGLLNEAFLTFWWVRCVEELFIV